MFAYLGKRFLHSLITLFIILCVVFVLVRQMPLDGYFPNLDKMSQEQVQNSIHQMGLDQPMVVQLYHFFRDLILHGDLATAGFVFGRGLGPGLRKDYGAYKADRKEEREAAFNYPLFLGLVYLAAAGVITWAFY